MTDSNDLPPAKPGKGSGPERQIESAFMVEFTRRVEAYTQAVSAGDNEQARAAAFTMLRLAGEEAERNPSPELRLMEQARECEARGAWGEAEAIFRQLLALAEASEEIPQVKYGRIFKTQSDLCNLFLLQSRYREARVSGAASLAAARVADLSPLLICALELEALCALRLEDLAGAVAAADEAVRLVEPGAVFDLIRGGAWVARARCRMLAGDHDLAEQDLVASQPLLFGKGAFDFCAGLHARAAGWWEVRGSLCRRSGNGAGAVEAFSRAVECRRHLAGLSQVKGPHSQAALARALIAMGSALRDVGDPSGAERIRGEGAKIWSDLGLPSQEAW